jgi:L,D-transpeptidase ErfK/SrfK
MVLSMISKSNNNQEITDFDQQALNKALKEQSGEPIAIYERLPPLEEASSATPAQAPEPAVVAKPVPVAVKLPRKASPDGYFHGN